MARRLWLLVALVLTVSRYAQAADTVETWNVGATDVDFYTGLDGVGAPREDRAVFGDMMLGYGIVDRLSAYAGATLVGDLDRSEGSSTQYLGIFGTPLETDHVDLDLFLDFSVGAEEQTFQISPALELNADADPDMGSWGVYLRAPFPIYGRKVESPLHPTGQLSETTFHVESTFGGYVMLSEGHQLLLEYDMGYHPKPAPEERMADVGGIALGYNVQLTDGLELINQLALDIPQGSERASVGLMSGFIATLPAGR